MNSSDALVHYRKDSDSEDNRRVQRRSAGGVRHSNLSLAFYELNRPTAFLTQPAGPAGVGVAELGPERRAIDDRDYEFIVPLPPRPIGATELRGV